MAWNFKKNFVEPNALNQSGPDGYENFISSESCLLVSGPARISAIGDLGTELQGIGLVEGVQISQQKNVNQLWEIGSRQSYFMPGRTMVQAQLSRVLFNGNNLMGAVYKGSKLVPSAADAPGTDSATTEGNFYIDLASSFFNKPFGLGIVINDSEDEAVQLLYLENCSIVSYQLGIQAQQLMVVDNMSIRCSRVKPIAYGTTRPPKPSSGGTPITGP